MPERRSRAVFALIIAIAAATFTYLQFARRDHSDFGMVWYGARALMAGMDPYSQIGPGKAFDYEWSLIYPVPALVLVSPLSWMSEQYATAVFVGVSCFLLAYGITRDGWYRVPVFVTSAFLTSVKLGQWSILFTAALFFPVLAVISAAKPQDALPVLASSTKSSTAVFAGLGGIALVAVSFLIFPQWVAEWSAAIRHAPHMTPLILRPGGVLVLAALMKWRRPETWLLLGLVATPHSWGWYAVLPMFTIPASFGEAVFLAGTALAGDWYANTVLDPQTVGGLTSSVGSIIIVTICLPCVAMILRRPNAGESPWWLPRPLSCPLISGRVRGAP